MTFQYRTLDCHFEPGTLVIRADADSEIGTGHVMRCLALAHAWQAAGGRAILLSHAVEGTADRGQGTGAKGDRAEPEKLDSPLLTPNSPLFQRVLACGVEYLPLAHRHPHPADLDATLGFLEGISSGGRGGIGDRGLRIGQEGPPLPTPHSPVPIPTWLAVDGYHFDAAYLKAVPASPARLLIIDDGQLAAPHLPPSADLVLNQNLGAEEIDYACDEHTTLLLGSRYTLLRPEFLHAAPGEPPVVDVARKVLVTLGGADPHNHTALVIRALEQASSALPGGLEAKIVLGGSFRRRHVKLLEQQLSQSPARFHLLSNVEDMPGLMAWADVALSAAGTTAWELALMGLPAALLVLAENQRPVAERLADAGAAINLGRADRLTAERIAAEVVGLCQNAPRRRRQSDTGRRLVDGRGATRVVAVMRALDDRELEVESGESRVESPGQHRVSRAPSLRLRPAEPADVRPLWRLASDPAVRQGSLSTQPIGWDEHARWFDLMMKKVADDRARIWVLDLEGLVLGSIRYERDGQQRAQVSLSVAAPFRRRHFATMLLERTWHRACEALRATQVRAVVRRENAASRQTFTQSGFTALGPAEVRGCACEVFEKAVATRVGRG